MIEKREILVYVVIGIMLFSNLVFALSTIGFDEPSYQSQGQTIREDEALVDQFNTEYFMGVPYIYLSKETNAHGSLASEENDYSFSVIVHSGTSGCEPNDFDDILYLSTATNGHGFVPDFMLHANQGFTNEDKNGVQSASGYRELGYYPVCVDSLNKEVCKYEKLSSGEVCSFGKQILRLSTLANAHFEIIPNLNYEYALCCDVDVYLTNGPGGTCNNNNDCFYSNCGNDKICGGLDSDCFCSSDFVNPLGGPNLDFAAGSCYSDYCYSGLCYNGLCIPEEVDCGDGIDNDADGSTDCRDNACSDECALRGPGSSCQFDTDCSYLNCAANGICGGPGANCQFFNEDGSWGSVDEACQSMECIGAINGVGDFVTTCTKANEIYCDDGIDNDLDNLIDCDDNNCDFSYACYYGGCDSDDDCSEGQCLHNECQVVPPGQEICDDQIDNDWDNLIDCDDVRCTYMPTCCVDIECETIDPCQNNGDCLATQVCDSGSCVPAPNDCIDSTDCPADQVCSNNICVNGMQPCVDNSECPTDWECNNGVCNDLGTENDNTCDDDSDCEGMTCGLYGYCGGLGAECGEDNLCVAPYECGGGFCGGEGAGCSLDNLCLSGECTDNLCEPGSCNAVEDNDYDGISACNDNCEVDRGVCAENILDCNNPSQSDGDADGVGDVCDLCRETVVGYSVDDNGCSNNDEEDDEDENGYVNCEELGGVYCGSHECNWPSTSGKIIVSEPSQRNGFCCDPIDYSLDCALSLTDLRCTDAMCQFETYNPTEGEYVTYTYGFCDDPDGDGIGTRAIYENDGIGLIGNEDCAMIPENPKGSDIDFSGFFGLCLGLGLLVGFYIIRRK
ncbi:hypothetical protein J4436_01145 [Candidatus Woesearchaeota archaeon]|nr:hypothetical protein [Candidatus Woesearchaeota archaeon]